MNSDLNLEGEISESDLLAILNLLVSNGKEEKLPISLNGLGYNNLIYSKMLGGHPMNLFCAALTAAPVTGDNSIVPIAIIAMAVVVVIAAVLLITSRKR